MYEWFCLNFQNNSKMKKIMPFSKLPFIGENSNTLENCKYLKCNLMLIKV